jgi:cystathionine beta-lyase/cystathionine gamma-synthase
VRRLYWPHAPDEPQADLTRRQLTRVSGMLSIELDTDLDGVERFCDGLQRFLMAVSWGGYESLALPIAGVRDWRGRESQAGVPVTLVRLSIGLEDPGVLIDDLAAAFARL